MGSVSIKRATVCGGSGFVGSHLVRRLGEIEIWGDGEQARSFLYVDECCPTGVPGRNSDNELIRAQLG